jgi:hypothetical protein
MTLFTMASEYNYHEIYEQQRQVMIPFILKSIFIGGLTGTVAGMADGKTVPVIGFLTEPVIRKYLLEELFMNDQLTVRQAEIIYWFAWVSSWIAWYHVR